MRERGAVFAFIKHTKKAPAGKFARARVRTFACGGEMVCYNITAYNEIINFTVSKREVYNSKLRTGIKAERGMVMKGKNLEMAVILGLLLSTGVYGTAWAEITNTKFPNEDSVIIEANSTVSPDTQIKDENGNEKQLYEFKNVTVYFSPQGNEDRVLGVYSARYQLENTNVIVHVGDEENAGQFVNADGLHLSNHFPKFYVRSYEAYIYGASSDALNLSHDITTDAYVYIGNTDEKMGVDGNGNLKAVIYDGNGIRANASTRGDVVNSITVGGETDITINGSTITREEERTITGTRHVNISYFGATVTAEVTANVSTSYNPTAVYAGNDMYNFTYNLNNLLEEDFGSETLGRGIVNLNNDTVIKLNGNGNYGIYSGKNGEINVNNVNIISTGENSVGIAAQNSNLIYGNPVNVTITDIDATAVADNSLYQGLVDLGLGMMVNSMIGESIIVDNADTSANKYGSTVILNGDKNVITMAEGGKALYANGKNLTDDDGEVIIKSGDNGIGNIDIVGDIEAENGGAIALDVVGNEQNYLQGDILAYGTQASKNASVNLTTNAALAYQGDALAANGGVVDVKLGDGSFWSGRADDYQDAADSNWLADHTGNLDTKFSGSVTGNGTVTMGKESTWNVTGQSWATELKGDDSYIILGSDENGNGYALHVNSVKGSNTFAMNVRPDETGNMLYVQNGINTQQNLVILNDDEVLENMDEGDAIRFATIKNSGGGFNGDGNISDDSVLPGNNVRTFGSNTRISDAGMFNVDFDIVYNDYNEKMDGDLAAENENSSVDEINDVYNGGEFSETKPGSEYVDEVYGGKTDGTETNSIAEAAEEDTPQNAYIVRKSVTKENLSDAGKTIINMSRANYKNAIYMDRLNKRLGEARYLNGEEEQGMWVRLRHDRIGMDGEFRSQNTMYEMGYDVKQDCDNGERRLGFAVDYMDGSTSYSDIIGKGETKRYGLWLYDTWLGDKGHYADYVLKWGHLQNDFDIKSKTRLEDISGDYSNNVFSVSAEYGKKNDMGNGWYFEPQAQLQLARVTGADYVTTQGSKVNVDGINSLIGRAGFRIGRDMDENSTVYLKADLLHEFMGDQTVTAADATGTLCEGFENKGTWYDVGFGFAAKMSKNSYAFMDFEKSFGNDNDETYQINAGMQWTF